MKYKYLVPLADLSEAEQFQIVIANAESLPGHVPARFFIKDSPYLKQRGVSGRGLFAAHVIEKGEIFGRYSGPLLTKKQTKHLTDNAYLFEVIDARGAQLWVIDGSDPARSSALRYINHAESHADQNALFEQINEGVYGRATQTIRRGQEILAHYGENAQDILDLGA